MLLLIVPSENKEVQSDPEQADEDSEDEEDLSFEDNEGKKFWNGTDVSQFSFHHLTHQNKELCFFLSQISSRCSLNIEQY